MGADLLDIQPLELRFTIEAKKQSSCSIQVGNKSDQYVAFKVKTTSPKKYCVRPNVGIIKPNGTCDFTVTMQVQRAAPLDLQCKDKFLIQGTIVPDGTTEEAITSDMFSKDSLKYIEERKLRVILVCLPQSAVVAPANGVPHQDLTNESLQKETVSNGVENLPPSDQESECFKTEKPVEDLRITNDAETTLTPAQITQEIETEKIVATKEIKNVEEIKSTKYETEELKKQSEDLKSKFDVLGLKLAEAEQTVAKLTEERSKAMQEKELVKRELALMKRRLGGKTLHIGFPLLYVCMVALICLTLGYLMQ